MTSNGDTHSFIMCILDASIDGVAQVWTPNRYSIVDDRSSHCLLRHEYSFLLLCPGCTCHGFEDVVSARHPFCYIVAMLVER